MAVYLCLGPVIDWQPAPDVSPSQPQLAGIGFSFPTVVNKYGMMDALLPPLDEQVYLTPKCW